MISTLSTFNYKIPIISKDSYITLKIKGPGNIYTFCNNDNPTHCSYEPAPLPNEIYINGNIQENITNIYYYDNIDNNVTLIWKNNIVQASCMFLTCPNIIEADLSHFDFSQAINIHAMFYGCTSLVSVNIPNLYSPKTNISVNYFYQCSSLEYVNIENLILSDNADLTGMFFGTNSKLILCTRSTKLKQRFEGNELINCKDNLDEINHNNEFKCYKKPSNAQNYINICEKCGVNYSPNYNNGEIINCYKNNESFNLDKSDLFPCFESCKKCEEGGNSINHNCTECKDNYKFELTKSNYLNCYQVCPFYYYIDNITKKSYCTQNMICPENYPNLIENKSECIDDCSKDLIYKYEFRKKCYQECPLNISYLSKNNYCETICTKDMPFEIVKLQICTNYCSINEMENKECLSKYEDKDTNANLILNNIHRDLIIANFNKSKLNNNQNIIIEEAFTMFIISTNKIQKNSNTQIVNLESCENNLKIKYNLDNTDNLIILIIKIQKDDNIEDYQIGYEVYKELENEAQLLKLDLNICNEKIMNNLLIKCLDYSIESLYLDLCISCLKPYYPKYNDTTNKKSFVKCYKNPKGYYYDNEEEIYKKCYHSCEECDNKGNKNEHNCLLCGLDYNYELKVNTHINCYKTCEFYFYYNQNDSKNYCTPNMLCPSEINKLLIPQKNKCIDDCKKDQDYPYEFRDTCYKECPLNISEKSKTTNFYCEAKLQREFPSRLIEGQKLANNCSIAEPQKNLYIINYESKERIINKEIEEKVVENVKEELTKDFNTSDIDNGENIIVKLKGSTIILSSTENQKNEKSANMTAIDLGECEYKIKDVYNN